MAKETSCVSIISRLWLVIVNTVLLLIAVLTIWAGVTFLQVSREYTVPNLSDSATHILNQINVKDLSIASFVFGGFYALTALSGCLGGCCRIVSFLTFYMVAIVIDMFLLVGVGGYVLYQIIKRRDAWNAITQDDWTSYDDYTKDFIQRAVIYIVFLIYWLIYLV